MTIGKQKQLNRTDFFSPTSGGLQKPVISNVEAVGKPPSFLLKILSSCSKFR